MFDNINTKYHEAKILIDWTNAQIAIKVLETEIENGNKTAENFAYLSKAYIYLEDFNKSLKYALKSIKILPNYSYGLARAGYACAKLNNNIKAINYCQKAEDLVEDNYCVLGLILFAYRAINEEFSAKKIAKKIINIASKDAPFFLFRGCAYDALEDSDKSLMDLKKNRKKFKNDYSLHNNISYSYLKVRKPKLALVYALKAISINDKNSTAYYRKGWALVALNNNNQALEAFLLAEKLGCKYPDMHLNLSYIYYINDEILKSLEYADKAILLNNSNEEAHYSRGQALYDLEKYEEALKSFLEAEKLGYIYAGMYQRISYMYSLVDENGKSLEYLNKAILLDGNDHYTYYGKGSALYALERYEEALKLFLKAEGLGYNSSKMYSMISNIYSYIDEEMKSLEYANKAILLDNKNNHAHYCKGLALGALGKYDLALATFLKAKDLGCEYEDLQGKIDFCKAKQGQ